MAAQDKAGWGRGDLPRLAVGNGRELKHSRHASRFSAMVLVLTAAAIRIPNGEQECGRSMEPTILPTIGGHVRPRRRRTRRRRKDHRHQRCERAGGVANGEALTYDSPIWMKFVGRESCQNWWRKFDKAADQTFLPTHTPTSGPSTGHLARTPTAGPKLRTVSELGATVSTNSVHAGFRNTEQEYLACNYRPRFSPTIPVMV